MGWIKLHREITDHWIWKGEPFTRGQAWVDILLQVNHSDNKCRIKGIVLDCKKGESLKSLETWAKRWNWTKSKVRRFFKLLEQDQMVVLKSEQITTRLIVCNYESYQDVRNANETDTKRTRNGDDTEATLNKKEEKERIKEIKNNIYGENWGKIENTYSEFKKMRNKIRKPMTNLAEIRIIEKLGNLSNKDPAEAIKILEQSIIKSWQDIFELKEKYENNKTGSRRYEGIPAADHESDRLHPGSDN